MLQLVAYKIIFIFNDKIKANNLQCNLVLREADCYVNILSIWDDHKSRNYIHILLFKYHLRRPQLDETMVHLALKVYYPVGSWLLLLLLRLIVVSACLFGWHIIRSVCRSTMNHFQRTSNLRGRRHGHWTIFNANQRDVDLRGRRHETTGIDSPTQINVIDLRGLIHSFVVGSREARSLVHSYYSSKTLPPWLLCLRWFAFALMLEWRGVGKLARSFVFTSAKRCRHGCSVFVDLRLHPLMVNDVSV